MLACVLIHKSAHVHLILSETWQNCMQKHSISSIRRLHLFSFEVEVSRIRRKENNNYYLEQDKAPPKPSTDWVQQITQVLGEKLLQ